MSLVWLPVTVVAILPPTVVVRSLPTVLVMFSVAVFTRSLAVFVMVPFSALLVISVVVCSVEVVLVPSVTVLVMLSSFCSTEEDSVPAAFLISWRSASTFCRKVDVLPSSSVTTSLDSVADWEATLVFAPSFTVSAMEYLLSSPCFMVRSAWACGWSPTSAIFWLISSAERTLVLMDSSSRAYSLRPFSSNFDSEVSCSGPALKFLERTFPPEISVKLLASTRLARVPALNSPSTFKSPPIVALPVVVTVAASMDPTLVRLPPCKVAVPSVMLLPWTLPVATISPLMLVVPLMLVAPLTVRLPPVISPVTERLAPVRAPFALISPRAEMLPVEVTVPPVTVPPVMVPVVLMLPLVMVAVPSVRVAPFTVPAPALMLPPLVRSSPPWVLIFPPPVWITPPLVLMEPPLVATLPAVSTVNLPSAPLMLPSALRAALAAAAVSPPA